MGSLLICFYDISNVLYSNTAGGSNSIKSGVVANKKTNSFRGVSANAGNIMDGDQPNPNSFLSPYEQLEAESEALVSKLLDIVSKLETNIWPQLIVLY